MEHKYYIVITGNPVDGYNYLGLWDDHEVAIQGN
jgi:hypothetical protein